MGFGTLDPPPRNILISKLHNYIIILLRNYHSGTDVGAGSGCRIFDAFSMLFPRVFTVFSRIFPVAPRSGAFVQNHCVEKCVRAFWPFPLNRLGFRRLQKIDVFSRNCFDFWDFEGRSLLIGRPAGRSRGPRSQNHRSGDVFFDSKKVLLKRALLR